MLYCSRCCCCFQGSQFSIWTGVDYSQPDHIALLVCIALGGYHPLVSYQWTRNGEKLEEEVHPLLYTTTRGDYTCKITGHDTEKSAECHFEVKGALLIYI